MQHVRRVLASSDQTRALTSRDAHVFFDGAQLKALADVTSLSVVFAV